MNDQRTGALREWQVIGVMTVVGAILRFWAFGGLSLTHFDEGIYAFSGLWIAADGGLSDLDPMIIAYSPPIFPILVGFGYLAGGVCDLSAIAAATVCGVTTLPIAGWLGRRTFGTGAGAATATFAALAMPHIAFSRKALTDAPFLFFWLLAISLGQRFLERPGFGRAIGLGLAVGLAENVKYNGWIAGLLVSVAALAGALARREQRRPGALLRTFGWGLLAALVATLAYLPWYGFVAGQHEGGYAALLKHHRAYLGGLPTWWPHWKIQMGEAAALAGPGWWGASTWVIAWLGCGYARVGPRLITSWTGRCAFYFLGGLGIGALVFSLQPSVGWWLLLGGAPWLVVSSQPKVRLLAAWWLVLSILTPFYHPYARLWLPLHALGWLVLAGAFVRLGPFGPGAHDASGSRDEPFRHGRRRAAGSLVVAALSLSAIEAGLLRPHALPLASILEPDRQRTLRRFVRDRLSREARVQGRSYQVWARRPLGFYLAEQGKFAFQTEPGVDRLLRPNDPDRWAIVDEAVLIQEGSESATRARLLRYWRPEWSFAAQADPVTLLDVEPLAAFQDHPRSDYTIWVFSPRNVNQVGPR